MNEMELTVYHLVYGFIALKKINNNAINITLLLNRDDGQEEQKHK